MEKNDASAPRGSRSRKRRGSYHHGNLKEALVVAAERQVARTDSVDLNLREVAALAGVSHAAAYRHFSGKVDLLAELARRGFGALETAVRSAAPGVAAPERLVEVGAAYVRFAMTSPGLFRVMFHPALKPFTSHPGLQEAAFAALSVLREILEEGRRQGEFSSERDLSTDTMVAWAALHGQAVLQLGHHLVVPFRLGESDAARAAKEVMRTLLVGLLRR